MPEVEIKSLCTRNRVSEDGVKLLCLLLYLPLGLLLLALRLILGLLLFLFSYVLPDVPVVQNVLSKLTSFCLGITINVDNPKDREDVKLFISNQVSILDHFVVRSATDSITPSADVQVNPLLASILGIRCHSPISTLDDIKKNVTSLISTKQFPVHLQPEGLCTNGKGLLKFKTWPFTFTPQLQAVSLEVSRPFLQLSVTTIEASYWKDAFFYLFSPCTCYRVRFLPLAEKKDLSDGAFSEKIQKDLAASLKVAATSFLAGDVLEWRKRNLLERMRRMSSANVGVNLGGQQAELRYMANQVKEVLPLVPFNVILWDLAKTQSVDITISNILEGHVAYTPEAEVKQQPMASSSSPLPPFGAPSSSKGDTLCTAASTFSKSAQERMLSFQERKAQLVQAARKKYIEKHGLNIVALNNC